MNLPMYRSCTDSKTTERNYLPAAPCQHRPLYPWKTCLHMLFFCSETYDLCLKDMFLPTACYYTTFVKTVRVCELPLLLYTWGL